MIGIVEADTDDFGGDDRDKSAHTFELRRLPFERGRSEDIAVQAEHFAIHDFGVENLFALLKPANSCHKRGLLLAEGNAWSQGERRACVRVGGQLVSATTTKPRDS
jgi:hypothetical protein